MKSLWTIKKIRISLSGIIIICIGLIVSAQYTVLHTVAWDNSSTSVKVDDKSRLNILLVGYWGEYWEWMELISESVIVVSWNPNTNEIKFKSLPFITFGRTAETLVNNAKIAASRDYWFYIDYYATMNFEAFREIIDILWWIDVYVDEPIRDSQFPNDVNFSNGNIQMNRDSSRGYAPFNIDAWRQHLDWETALKYVRSKKTTSEENRKNRQEKVLQAIIDKISVSWFDISQLYNLYNVYDKKIITDISLKDATWMVWEFRGKQIVSQEITNSDLWWTYTYDTNNYNEWKQAKKSENLWYTTEQKDAYKFAKSNWITTTSTLEKAKMNASLKRIEMAKMLSYYAINVLEKKPDTKKIIKFDDVSSQLDAQYNNAVTLAYQLWIMWQNVKNNKFRPNDEVTRAEFATALSRMLYWMEDWKWKTKYYEPHISKLYNEWIISKTDPRIKERRWYVMIMLMRSAK